MNRRSNGGGQLGVKIIGLFHCCNFMSLCKSKSSLHINLCWILITFNWVKAIEAKPGISSVNCTSDENHLVAQIFHTNLSYSSNTIKWSCCISSHFGGIDVLALDSFSGFKHLNNIRNNHQLSGEDCLVSRFWHVNHLSSEDNIETSWHWTSWDITGLLLDLDLLPIHHHTVFVDELPPRLVKTLLVWASDRLRELELLLHILNILLTFQALECTRDQLWFGISSSGHCTIDWHQAAKAESSKLSDLVHLRQVIDSYLVPSVLSTGVIVSSLLHELHKCPP